jgi:hypothetical protein
MLVTLALGSVGCNNQQANIEAAQAQVNRVKEQLDTQTTKTGAYEQVDPATLQEFDPWGTKLDVVYAKGGLAETVTVRSAGPDRKMHTEDDLSAVGVAANLTGVGHAIKSNVEETTASAAKGMVRGVVEGIKESLPFRKTNDGEESAEDTATDSSNAEDVVTATDPDA